MRKKHLPDFAQWAVNMHENTNHMYDDNLPYRYHLEMVERVAEKFKYIWMYMEVTIDMGFYDCINLCYGHDLIKHTRVTYNDIREQLERIYNHRHEKIQIRIADIIYALTNEKGKNREERANDKYYEGIRQDDAAIFIKLCDRIANVMHGVSTNSSMLEKYKQENPKFIVSLLGGDWREFKPMVVFLETLFELRLWQ